MLKKASGIACALFIMLVLSTIIQCSSTYLQKSSINRVFLNRYDVSNADISHLQYYLSKELVLYRAEDGNSYHYDNRSLDVQDTYVDKYIVFRAFLPGKYVSSAIRRGRWPWEHERMHFKIQFDKPEDVLDFIETDDGFFKLVSQNGFVQFDQGRYGCRSGYDVYLMVDIRQLDSKFRQLRRYIGGP